MPVGSKLGLILSLAFAIEVLCFMGDLSCLQATVAKLDAASISISRIVAERGGVDRKLMIQVSREYGALIEPVTTGSVQVGDVFVYDLVYDYVPISFIGPFAVTIRRSAVIGYID